MAHFFDNWIPWKRMSEFHEAATFGSTYTHTHAIAITDSDDPVGGLGCVPIYWGKAATAGARVVADLDGGFATENVSSVVNLPFGLADGTPVLCEVSTFGDTGYKMNTDADSLSKKIYVPRDWDTDRPIGFKVHWTSGSATSADTIDWTVTYKDVREDAAIAAPSSALDRVIAEDTVGAATAWLDKVTAPGYIRGGVLSRSLSKFLFVNVAMTTKAAGLTEDIFFLGLEITYVPKMTTKRSTSKGSGD